MQSALRLKTIVLPGHRVEFGAPELMEGEEVELIVLKPEGKVPPAKRQFNSAWEYIQSLKPVVRTAEEWEAIEQELRTEKDSWDR